ncbi:fasciclin domain-containing protein [Gemmatimonas sp.]|uniref:fasciclin domain-containing protein n=1 Tax=Gemmatimonas sp. TaxID=1962908 RepID=UPI003983C177
MTLFCKLPAVALLLLAACAPASDQAETSASTAEAAAPGGGQAAVDDTVSQPNVVRVALGSKDHTTLVAALQAADLVNSLANAGPFTVFAPTNAAFDKLPAGTVETLLKPENKLKLKTVLHHHVTTSALDVADLADGQSLSMVDGVSEAITKKDGATYIGGAKVIASVRASNGWVHVIDGVLVPPAK